MTESICKEGIVRAVNGDNIEVEITVSSACSECHAKSICIPTDRRRETVTAQNLHGERLEPGDKVLIMLEGAAGNRAVVLAYVLPFIVLMAALFGTYAITRSELAGVIASVACVVLYYIVLKTQHKKIDRNIRFYAKRA